MSAIFLTRFLLGGLLAFSRTTVASELMHWNVDGVDRQALVVAPLTKAATRPPLLLVFHGHGGKMQLAERGQAFHETWPEAVVVYPQGLPTPGYLHDEQGRMPGWQHDAGENDDRDLKFVDTIITTMRDKFSIDQTRVYATGFSNGGFFCYLLWAERPDVFAAVAPGAALMVPSIRLSTPKPVMIYGGRNDRLVPFSRQEAAIAAAKSANGCTPNGETCGFDCVSYSSRNNAPVVTFIHDGGHRFAPEVRSLIVQFFQRHPLSAP